MKRIASLVAVLALTLSFAFTAPPGKGKHKLMVIDPVTDQQVTEVLIGKCYTVEAVKAPFDRQVGFGLDLQQPNGDPGLFLRFFVADVRPDGGNRNDGTAVHDCVVFPMQAFDSDGNLVQIPGRSVIVGLGFSSPEMAAVVVVDVRAKF